MTAVGTHTDYPHNGSNGSNSSPTLDRVFRGVPKDEVKKMLSVGSAHAA